MEIHELKPESRRLWEEWIELLVHPDVEQKPTAQTLRNRLTPPSNVKLYRFEDLFRCDGDNEARLHEYEEGHRTAMALFEPEDAGVISSMNRLAYASYYLGKFSRSVELFGRLRKCETMRDREKAVINYGLARSHLECHDDLEIAMQLCEENVTQKSESFIVLASKVSLAQKKPRKRLAGLEKEIMCLNDSNTVDLLMMRSNLLWLDDPNGAKPKTLSMLKQYLQQQKTALKEDKHPDILENIAGIGYYHSYNDNPEEAAKYFKRAFEGRKIVLGCDHPKTVSVQNSMAHSLDEMGKPDVQIFRSTVEQMEKIFPKDERILETKKRLDELSKRKFEQPEDHGPTKRRKTLKNGIL